MPCRAVHLVVDSGAFIRNFSIQEHADNVYSVSGAVDEIKDKATRQRLQVLPYTMKLKEPESENFKYVAEFAKKTGDYSSLSATDLKIIALTYQLEKEHVGTAHLNTEPSCKVTGKLNEFTKPLEGFYIPEKGEKGGLSENISESLPNGSPLPSENTENIDSKVLFHENNVNDNKLIEDNNNSCETDDVSDDNEEEEDDDSWITPDNLAEVQRKMGNLVVDDCSELKVACVTTDFAVQNVLLQLGLHVISVDGLLIKQARVFILRCFACFKTTNDTTKKFCPNCGNSTLKRVSVTVNDDGSKNIHVNFRRPINIRGKKYSLPMPKGGKHSTDPILCEDQPVPHNRPPKSSLCKVDVLSPDYVTSASPFATHDVYSRAAGLGIMGKNMQGRRQRKNPNEWSKRTGNRK